MFAFSMCGGIVREEINIFPWSGYWIITTPYESYAIDSPFKISVKDNIVYLYVTIYQYYRIGIFANTKSNMLL